MELGRLATVGIDLLFVLTGQQALKQKESELVEDYRAATDSDKTSGAPARDAVAESTITNSRSAAGDVRGRGWTWLLFCCRLVARSTVGAR